MRNIITALTATAATVIIATTPALADQTASFMIADISRENVGVAQIKHTAPQIAQIGQAEYSDFDREMRHSGNVVVQVELNASGKVIHSSIATTSGLSSLDRSALAVVGSAKYRPETIGGTAVGGTYAVTVGFDSKN